MIIAILCGGSGTRLFPLSRELMPKQFVPLIEGESLFQATIKRNYALGARFFIITNEAHFFLAKDEISKHDFFKNGKKSAHFILESISKNTAPALLSLALQVRSEDVILALPSDHLIKDLEHYKSAVKEAESLAKQGKIALFGIKPTEPNTGYGYIHESRESGIEFIEKPDIKKAREYFANGAYFWNSGMFCFQAGVLIEEFKKHQSALFEGVKAACENAEKCAEFTRLKREDCENLEDISIDYAIMEKSANLRLVRADFKWSDVGSFNALKNEFPSDSSGNAHSGEILALESEDNFVLSDKLTAILGVKNLAIINTADCLLVSNLDETQRIREVVKILKSQNSEIVKIHNTAFRPWGSYTVLLDAAHYKIKQLIVRPKKRLSLQKHFHRNEHWIVVSGSAVVKIDEREFVLCANESTYIPMGSVHRLGNEGKINLVMIEVQVGEYLGEDDIVRIEDDFNRA